MNKQEYDKGYQDAIDNIKRQIEAGKSKQDIDNSSDADLNDPNRSQNQGQQGQGQQDQGQQGQGSGAGSRRGQGNQGVVRPEDCMGPGELDNTPGAAGGIISTNTGDEITKQEGHNPETGSEDSIEKEWKDAVIKNIGNLKGAGSGALQSKLLDIYKTNSDWRKELRKVVGQAISPEDKRSAYANKNVLITQNRISRTDKDKYNNMSYMMAWIDSSGSMSDEQLRLCLSEVYSVALAKKPLKLVVVQCDTQIQSIDTYTDLRQLKRELRHATVKGRGGTNLKPCWDLLINDPKYKRMPCELVMVFTDGYLDQYKRNPRTMQNLCWVILDNPGFVLQYKDIKTKVVYLKTENIK